MTIDEVCDAYLQCESMKETARKYRTYQKALSANA